MLAIVCCITDKHSFLQRQFMQFNSRSVSAAALSNLCHSLFI